MHLLLRVAATPERPPPDGRAQAEWSAHRPQPVREPQQLVRERRRRGSRGIRQIRPRVWVRAASKRVAASAQLTTFHQAFT